MKTLKLNLIPAVILLITLSAGCGKDKTNPTGPESNVPAELQGTWYFQSVTVYGYPADLGDILDWDSTVVAARFTVGSDESVVYQELDAADSVVWTQTGTFTVDGDSATLTFTEDDDGPIVPPLTLSGTWSLNQAGDELMINGTYNSIPIVVVAVRNP